MNFFDNCSDSVIKFLKHKIHSSKIIWAPSFFSPNSRLGLDAPLLLSFTGSLTVSQTLATNQTPLIPNPITPEIFSFFLSTFLISQFFDNTMCNCFSYTSTCRTSNLLANREDTSSAMALMDLSSSNKITMIIQTQQGILPSPMLLVV